MLAKIIRWSIQNKFLVLLATFFLIAAGIYSLETMPLDAIPDLSDVQVIIYTQYPGQAPQIVEDQVTYPLTTQMLAVPRAQVVRGYSFFGYSFVYVIFQDGTDLYWARSRVLEYLNYVSGRLPRGVSPTLGPDATGVGWAYIYALTSKNHDLSQLRSIQDWFLKYQLTSVPGVAEVASIGGFVRQYQITVDPDKLRAYDVSISRIREAVQRSNLDVGGGVLEISEKEFMIRGLGYIKNLDDVAKIAVGVDRNGTPILLRNVATLQYGPEQRRGLAEWNGEGETVGGIVIVRYGANTLRVLKDVKARLAEIEKSLPPGVEVHVAYDRSNLIERAVATLKQKLVEESAIVALVCVIFLLHFGSAFVAIFTLPVAVLIAFIIMHQQGINANIMSLGGIAIAIGAMVDAAIIMIENAHKHVERDAGKKPHWDIVTDAAIEVGPALFYSLLVITVSFMPVFTLQAQEGRLFKPLAFTKTYSMAAAALLSITLVPVLMGYFIRWKILPEEKNPINRVLIRLYHPLLEFVLRFRWLVLAAAVLVVGVTIFPYTRLGSEFMPPLWEGDLLYMPSAQPGMSIAEARTVLQQTDKMIKQFPEVHHVFGKAGRAETATDPATIEMFETTIMLKPEDQWPKGMTPNKLIREMNSAIQVPGLSNTWTMPIKTRVDMLSTGIKTPVGIKLSGPDLKVLDNLGQQIQAVIQNVPGTASVYAERTLGGNYLDARIDRDAIARYGMTISDVQDVIESAVGGMNITTTVEGLQRYPVNVRYMRELRQDVPTLRGVLVSTPTGQQIPLGQLAKLSYAVGPPMIKTEAARPNAWIYVDIRGADIGRYVRAAQQAVQQYVKPPAGYTINWSGEYEYMQRAQKRLMYVIPMTILIIFVIIYLNTKSLVKTAIVFLAVPFSLAGAIWLLYVLGYNLSIAVWVGIIALAGLDAETGVVMLLYLDQAYESFRARDKMKNRHELADAVYEGAVKRVRPKVMTISVIIAGLLPIMWSHGTGADVMKRIAAPMVGGVITSGIMELAIYPVIFYLWRGHRLPQDGSFRGFQHLR